MSSRPEPADSSTYGHEIITELRPDQYTTIIDQWLLENLVNASVGDTDDEQ